jgi:diguanylate cyclase
MEALIRWLHPEWGVVSPLEFIPVAESCGLILPIGDWVLEEACRQWCLWQNKGLYPGKMSVNLSAIQFKDERMSSAVENVLKKSGMPAENLVLEITESVLMVDAESALSQLKTVQDLGVRLSVDDFGTGYSSLSYLKIFPLDYLKIDRSFVRDLESSESDREIVRTIINMAKNLNLELVAEGVETPGQLRILHDEGCESMQGYLLSRPVDAADYEQSILSAESSQNEKLKVCKMALSEIII